MNKWFDELKQLDTKNPGGWQTQGPRRRLTRGGDRGAWVREDDT